MVVPGRISHAVSLLLCQQSYWLTRCSVKTAQTTPTNETVGGLNSKNLSRKQGPKLVKVSSRTLIRHGRSFDRTEGTRRNARARTDKKSSKTTTNAARKSLRFSGTPKTYRTSFGVGRHKKNRQYRRMSRNLNSHSSQRSVSVVSKNPSRRQWVLNESTASPKDLVLLIHETHSEMYFPTQIVSSTVSAVAVARRVRMVNGSWSTSMSRPKRNTKRKSRTPSESKTKTKRTA
mmetsp:Transcript_61780/g.151131  ORF Transcript_61780/g.151131 Transcript_61780/m.151131 type:complete len:232 (+) Transcript_61780:1195-1890(+)